MSLETKKSFSFNIKKGLNPIQIKDRMLELQNYYSQVSEHLLRANREHGVLEANLKYIKDTALLQVEEGTTPIKEARSKTEIKVKVDILEGDKKIEKELTYHECAFLLVKTKNKVDEWIRKSKELDSSIDSCRFYPVKGMI